jgi:hypothetical protein
VEVAEKADVSTVLVISRELGALMMRREQLLCESLWCASTMPSPVAVERGKCSGARGGGSVCVTVLLKSIRSQGMRSHNLSNCRQYWCTMCVQQCGSVTDDERM